MRFGVGAILCHIACIIMEPFLSVNSQYNSFLKVTCSHQTKFYNVDFKIMHIFYFYHTDFNS